LESEVKMINTAEEILIYLEDKKRSPFKDFPIKNSRKLRGALGRLLAWKWVKKIGQGTNTAFQLTNTGVKELDNTLSVLRTAEKAKENNLFLIIFQIAENKRDLREKLRRALVELGAAILHSGVWIATTDISQQIKKISKNLKISDKIMVLKIESTKDLNNKLTHVWDLKVVNDNYSKFIKESQHLIKNPIGNNVAYKAKKLIYLFATILKKDPHLAGDLLPQNWKAKQARTSYQKLRKLVI